MTSPEPHQAGYAGDLDLADVLLRRRLLLCQRGGELAPARVVKMELDCAGIYTPPPQRFGEGGERFGQAGRRGM